MKTVRVGGKQRMMKRHLQCESGMNITKEKDTVDGTHVERERENDENN